MKPMIFELLQTKKSELNNEQLRVEAMLRDCGRTKNSPPNDYWLPLYKLRKQVDLLNQLKELL